MNDREKIISAIERAKTQSKKNALDSIIVPFKEADMIIALLKEQETVIRCKDCIYWHESATNHGYGDCGQANGIALKDENWYCADRKRR